MNDVESVLLCEINMAIFEKEVPIACLIRRKGKIIVKNHNRKINSSDPTAHAEILCIREAAKKLSTWNLSDCELYVTMKPCAMCESVINEARIKKVYYYLDNPKIINNTTIYKRINNDTCQNVFKDKIQDFFKDKR